jgi:DNA replication initiation complex subunit (GINS family)
MSEGAIEFGEVSNIYRLEREKRGELAKIPDDFFQRLREHITELRRQAGVEEAQNQGSKKAMMLLEDVKKLSVMSDSIHDSRERKIVILAQQRGDLSKASLTSHERELVKHLRERLEAHRDRLEGKHAHGKDCRPADGTAGTTPEDHPSDAHHGATQNVAVLQVIEDVGEFATAERDYNLRKADVVSLPREFASVLVQQGKARELIVSQ